MEFKGTNTEWSVYGENKMVVVNQKRQLIASTGMSLRMSIADKIGNAKLIAAAPELLMTAKIGLGALEILSTFLKDAKLEANNHSIEIVKAAIKKAL